MIFIKKSAFTIIELMVLVAIISTLVATVVPYYFTLIGSAKVSKAIDVAKKQVDYVKEYYTRTGTFPGSVIPQAFRVETLVLCTAGCGDPNIEYIQVGRSGVASNPTAAVKIMFTTAFKNEFDPTTHITRRSLSFIIKDVNGVLEVRCGQTAYAGSTPDLRSDLLPGSCQQNVAVWFNE